MLKGDVYLTIFQHPLNAVDQLSNDIYISVHLCLQCCIQSAYAILTTQLRVCHAIVVRFVLRPYSSRSHVVTMA